MVARLNPWMPAGIRAVACWEPIKPVRDLAMLEAEVTFVYDGGVPAGCAQAIAGVLQQDSIIIQKRTKHKAMADVDIRPMLHEVEIEEFEKEIRLHVLVQAQNPGVNPALLANAIENYLPAGKPDHAKVHRLAFLDSERKEFR